MATGPDHYREAERLLETVRSATVHDYDDPTHLPVLAAAQVHATLALAAATAPVHTAANDRAWLDAAGTKLASP